MENERLETTVLKTNSSVLNLISEKTSQVIKKEITLSQLISRPRLDYKDLKSLGLGDWKLNFHEIQFIEIELKYQIYIRRQESVVSNIEKMMDARIGKKYKLYENKSNIKRRERKINSKTTQKSKRSVPNRGY